MIDPMVLWNAALTILVALMGTLLKGRLDELDRISILLNRTREEIARDHVTRSEVALSLDKIYGKLDRLDKKLDEKVELLRAKGDR